MKERNLLYNGRLWTSEVFTLLCLCYVRINRLCELRPRG